MKQSLHKSIVTACCSAAVLMGCTQTVLQVEGPPGKGDMVHVPAGWFWMGLSKEASDRFVEACTRERAVGEDCAAWFRVTTPRHRVWLDAFWLDRHEVSNADFRRFVQTTGHVTDAERENKGGSAARAGWRLGLVHGGWSDLAFATGRWQQHRGR